MGDGQDAQAWAIFSAQLEGRLGRVPGDLERGLALLRGIPIQRAEKKRTLLLWCDRLGVECTREMVEYVCGADEF